MKWKSFCLLAFEKCLVGNQSEITGKCRELEERQEVPGMFFSFFPECIVLRCLEMGFCCLFFYRHFTFCAETTATTYSTDNLKICLYQCKQKNCRQLCSFLCRHFQEYICSVFCFVYRGEQHIPQYLCTSGSSSFNAYLHPGFISV